MGFEIKYKYGQLLKYCRFKYKERKDSESEENFTNVRRENISLSWPHKMKYLITGLKFVVKNPQAPLENTPLVAQPLPPENKKKIQPHSLKMLQRFYFLPP